jgi:diadenosine tetraphosphatase ApaH/serine/threonine PP2A family protein phosphatase
VRALVLSDIHANLEALDAVLTAAGEWDALWNLGDMVGYGASPNEVVERMRALATLTVRGNHDRVCCGLDSAMNFNPTAREAAIWTQNALTEDNKEWLRGLPQGPVFPYAGGAEGVGLELAAAEDVTADEAEELNAWAAAVVEAEWGQEVSCAHGSPLGEDEYILSMRDAWAPLQQMTTPIAFVGHTHVQGGFAQAGNEWHEIRPRYGGRGEAETWTLEIRPGTRELSTRHLINPGSVGQPRDYDWRAAFAIYDSERGVVEYRRVAYDVRAAQARILRAGLPERLAERLREGR